MVKVITDLNDKGVEDTIVVGFDIYLENVKRMKNSDLLVAITSQDTADAAFAKVSKVQVTNDSSAQKVNLSDEEFVKQYPLSYNDMCTHCKSLIVGFKQGKMFNDIMGEIKKDPRFAFTRRLNPNNSKSSKTTFYTNDAVGEVVSRYSTEDNDD